MNFDTNEQDKFKAYEELLSILESSKKTTDNLTNNLPIIYIMVDDEYRIVKTNKIALDFLAAPEINVLGKTFFDFLDAETKESFGKNFKLEGDGSEPAEGFETKICSDDETRYIYWQLNSIKTTENEGYPVHVVLGSDISDLRKMHEEMKALENQYLTEQIEIIESKVEEKTRQIKSILRNINQGIFTLETSDAIVHDDYSSQLESIVETVDIAGEPISKLLLEKTNLTIDEQSAIQSCLVSMIDSSFFTFEANAGNLPREVEFTVGNKVKILEIDWAPICDQNENITKILVALKDITMTRDLKKKTENQQKELQLLGEVINTDLDQIESFIADSEYFLAENRRLFSETKKEFHKNIKSIFVNLHTMKGSSRSLGFRSLSETIHEVETLCHQALEEGLYSRNSMMTALVSVDSCFKQYLYIHRKVLGHDENSVGKKFDDKTAMELVDKISTGCWGNLPSAEHQLIGKVEHFFLGIMFRNSGSLLEEVFSSLGKIARDLNKDTPNFSIHGDEFFLTQKAERLVRTALIHLIRNSLDHGLETRNERREKDKPASGRIQVSLQQQDGQLTIKYGDDGRGLDVQALKKSGIEKGLIADSVTDRPTICELIFESGLSTSREVTQISGRGIGMDAVRNILRESGGDIQLNLLESTGEFVPFQFSIALGSELFVKPSSQPG